MRRLRILQLRKEWDLSPINQEIRHHLQLNKPKSRVNREETLLRALSRVMEHQVLEEKAPVARRDNGEPQPNK
jgi:hypothetical protein